VEFLPHERIIASGRIATKTVYIPGSINRVSVSGIIDLHLFLGEEARIEIHADDNVLPHITMRQTPEVDGLEIYTGGVSFVGHAPEITVYLTLKDLRELRFSGRRSTDYMASGKRTTAHLHLLPEQTLVSDRLSISASGTSSVYFETYGRLDANRLAITLSGASSFRGDNISAGTINATLSGSSTLNLAGESTQFYLTSSGTSRTRAFDLISDHLNARLSGSSNAQVTVQETLRATLSGSSWLIYAGNPDILHSQTSGVSSLRRW